MLVQKKPIGSGGNKKVLSRVPMITNTGNQMLINVAALKLLTQDGEKFVTVEKLANGNWILKPFKALDVAALVIPLTGGGAPRMACQLLKDHLPKARVECMWNGEEEGLEILEKGKK